MAEPTVISQGTSFFPVTYDQPTRMATTTLDPYNINMYLDYGPINIYNDDRTIPEAERQTFFGWYFSPKIDGATISLYEGEIVVMYVQIQNPTDATSFESWSCSAQYQMKDTVYVGQVFNYDYGSSKLDNDAVERDSANVQDQTTGHPEYMRNGPWMAANALQWYQQTYSIEDNYTSLQCTGIRQYGEGQKGFFDLQPGDAVTLEMGYRVYEDASQTRARTHRDYPKIEFVLENPRPDGANAVMLSSGSAAMLAVVSIFLVF